MGVDDVSAQDPLATIPNWSLEMGIRKYYKLKTAKIVPIFKKA